MKFKILQISCLLSVGLTQGAGKELVFPIPFPEPIGTIIATGTMAPPVYSFKASSKKNIDLGVLKFSNPQVSFANTTGLKLAAEAKILGKINATLALEHFSTSPQKELLFSLQLASPIKLPLGPSRNLILGKLYFLLSGTEKQLFTRLNLLSPTGPPDTTIIFGTTGTTGTQGTSSFAQIELSDIKLSELVDDLAGSPAGNIALKQAIGRVTDPFTAGVPRTVTFTGILDASALKGSLPPSVKLDALNTQARYNPTTGLNITASLGTTIPFLPGCALLNPQITINRATGDMVAPLPGEQPAATTPPPAPGKKVTDIILSGEVDLTLPNNIGVIKTKLTGYFRDGKFAWLDGTVGSDLKIQGVPFPNATISINPKLKQTKITTRTVFQGDAIDMSCTLQKVTVNNVSSWDITLAGTFVTKTTLQPFTGCGIADLESITINNLGLALDKKTKAASIFGTVTIMGIGTDAALMKGPEFAALKLHLRPGANLAAAMPFLAGSPLANVDPSKVTVIITPKPVTGAAIDPRVTGNIGAGVTLLVEMPLPEAIGNLAPNVPRTALAIFALPKTPKDLKIQAQLPTSLKLSDQLIFTGLAFEYDADGPNNTPKVGLRAALQYIPSNPNATPLNFSTFIAVAVGTAQIAGTMQGTWKQPLGIDGFELRNVAVQVALKFPPLVPPPLVPSEFGITGGMNIGSVSIDMAAKVGIDPTDIILMGKCPHLTLKDLADGARGAGAPIPVELVPDAGFHNVDIKVAPKAGSIGDIQFSQGLTLKGELDILDKVAIINVTIDKTGIMAEGSMSKIDLGPVSITGAGLDQKYSTGDDGPVVHLALTPQKQDFFASGDLNIFGAKAQVEISVSKNGFSFLTTAKIDNLSIRDLITLALAAGQMNINLDQIPDLKLEGVECTVGMNGKNFKTFSLDPGIKLKAHINVLGERILVDGITNNSGLSLHGTIANLKIGPLEVTGMGADGQYGTADDGATIAIDATKDKQQFLISGAVSILGSKMATDLILGTEKVSFKVEMPFLSYKAIGNGTSSGSGKNTDFAIGFKLDNKVTADVGQQLDNYLKTQADVGTGKIKGAINAVESARSALQVIDNRIAELRRLIGSNDQHINPFDLQLLGTYRDHQLLTYNKNPRFLYTWFWDDIASAATSAYNATAAAATAAYNAAAAETTRLANIAAAEATRLANAAAAEATRLANAAAAEATRIAKEIADTKTFRQIELGGCIAAREVANGVLIGAQETLKLASQGLDLSTKAARWVVSNAIKFNINSASIDIASLRDLGTGKLPIINFEITFNGKPLSLHIEFDLKDIPGLMQKLGEKIAAEITSMIT